MNIWALDKHERIKHLLLLLQNHLGGQNFVLDQVANLDTQAVYLSHPKEPGIRAYLYTLGQEPTRCGLHLEYPESVTNASLIDAYENLTVISLLNILAVHFDVDEIRDLELLAKQFDRE